MIMMMTMLMMMIYNDLYSVELDCLHIYHAKNSRKCFVFLNFQEQQWLLTRKIRFIITTTTIVIIIIIEMILYLKCLLYDKYVSCKLQWKLEWMVCVCICACVGCWLETWPSWISGQKDFPSVHWLLAEHQNP